MSRKLIILLSIIILIVLLYMYFDECDDLYILSRTNNPKLLIFKMNNIFNSHDNEKKRAALSIISSRFRRNDGKVDFNTFLDVLYILIKKYDYETDSSLKAAYRNSIECIFRGLEYVKISQYEESLLEYWNGKLLEVDNNTTNTIEISNYIIDLQNIRDEDVQKKYWDSFLYKYNY